MGRISKRSSILYDRRVKRLPVVNTTGRLVGIVSRVDVLTVFSRADEEIREEIVSAVLPGIVPKPWKDLEVAVQDGIVTVSGTPLSEATTRAVLDAVRHVQGVVAVRDRLR